MSGDCVLADVQLLRDVSARVLMSNELDDLVFSRGDADLAIHARVGFISDCVIIGTKKALQLRPFPT